MSDNVTPNPQTQEEAQPVEQQPVEQPLEATSVGRKPRHSHNMRIFHNLTKDEAGNIANPRRDGTYGHRAMQLVIDAGDEGISYKDYLLGGGRPNDLGWDLKRNNVRIVDTELSPETQEEKAKAAEAARAAKNAKAEARAAAKAERDELRNREKEAKAKIKAEADAARAKAKAEAKAAQSEAIKLAAANLAASKQTVESDVSSDVNVSGNTSNGSGNVSVANADAADENRKAVEHGVGPLPIGNAPTTADALATRRGVKNQTSGVPV